MIPNNNLNNIQVKELKQPSKTYKIDSVNGRITGIIDGLEAVKQSADTILSTERYVYPIYTWAHGVELDYLVGKDYELVSADLKRRMKEALLQDDRITEVTNFTFMTNEDGLYVKAEVISDYGNFDIERKVDV